MKKVISLISVAALGLGGIWFARQNQAELQAAQAMSQQSEIAAGSASETASQSLSQAQSNLLSKKLLAQMSEQEISSFLTELQPLPFLSRLDQITAQAKGTPYFLGPLGEGPEAPFDKKPLIDLTRVDCVTFCEQSLAMAMSSDYASAFKTLQKIRYKNGEVKMECRNHYTMADWTVNNRWFLTDVTPQMPQHQMLTRTISHKQLFANQKFEGIAVREPDRTLKVAYIPEDRLMEILPNLRSGDVGVLIQNMDGIFAAHTGFMFKQANGKWIYRNATSIGPKVVTDTPFEVLVDSLKNSKRLIGMSFIRPRQP